MIYSLGLLDSTGQAIVQALRSGMGYICASIFTLITYLYRVFVYLAKARIVDNEYIQTIYRRVGLILGIFMVFKLVFSLIQSLIDPSKLSDKKVGVTSIIYRSIIAIVLLGTTPAIFNEVYRVQNFLIGANNSENVLYKLIVGSSGGALSNTGEVIGSDLYFTFYTDNEEPFLDNGTRDDYYDTDDEFVTQFIDDNFENLERRVKGGELSYYDTVPYLVLRDNTYNKYIIELSVIPMIGIGAFIVWMFAMYCVQVGVRVVQLAFLQLVAPVPILSYISDPEGIFKKWLNYCFTTFIDVFVRLAIIFFTMSVANDVLTQIAASKGILYDSTGMMGESWFTIGLIKILILLGLLLFASRAPELIKDLFNLKGTFNLSLDPKKVFNDTLAASAIGGTVGFLGGASSNAIHGGINAFKNFKKGDISGGFKSLAKTPFSMIGGAVGGARAGLKTKDITKTGEAVKTANQNREKRELKANAGYHWYNPLPTVEDNVLGFAGETTGAEKRIKEAERQKQALEISRTAMWKKAEDDVKNNVPGISAEKYSFMRGLERTDKVDKTKGAIYRGFDKDGNTVEIFEDDLATDVRTAGYENEIKGNADIDESIKKQNKVIKGLETANNDAKK